VDEWTDRELLDELFRFAHYENGGYIIQRDDLARVLMDPRYPQAKHGHAVELLKSLKNTMIKPSP
jgi:hypothetical protein